MKCFFLRIFPCRFVLYYLPVFAGLFSSCAAQEPYPDVLPIGQIRGEVPEAGDASRHRARLNKETVTVRGMMHQLLRWRTQKGEDAYAMLIQNLPADADNNPDSSDGLFVYLGKTPSVAMHPQGDLIPETGDLLTLRGTVNERYGQTELSEVKVLAVEKGGVVEKSLPAVELSLPEAFSERDRMLEKLEGMRVRFPAGSVAVSGTHPNIRTWDAQLWVVPANHPAAVREEPAARRLYRAAHSLSSVPEELKNDMHGQRLVLGSLGLVERLEDRDVSLPSLWAGSQCRDALIGGIHYSWGEYVLQVNEMPEFTKAEKQEALLLEASDDRIRVAAYNVENLYDFRDDPFDDCDFQDDEGCPGSRFPLNYVPLSDEVYRARLGLIAEQILEDLAAPEILMIQEVEDQDIGRLADGMMVYGDENHADGEVDALQELVLEILLRGGPEYAVLVDRDGADDRGIVCAWLVQSERFRTVDAGEVPAVFGEKPDFLDSTRQWLPICRDATNPKAFNALFEGTPDHASEMTTVFSRAMQVLLLEDVSTGQRIWLQNNHFSSGPNRRVDRRRAQAAVNAELSRMIRAADPDAVLIVGGDLNVFPRPDDPLDPPSDQLAPLYATDLVNVYDDIAEADPARAYSYIYRGVTNVLDHFFLSDAARERLTFAAYLKLNADAPEGFPDAAPLRASDHDPLLIELKWGGQ